MIRVDRRRSLQDLEGEDWGDPPTDTTHLVSTVHKLRRKPLDELTTENLRTLIGQDVGSIVLVPLALDILRQNPMVQGDFYPGDLLNSVLRLPAKFWRDNPHLAEALEDILNDVRSFIDNVDLEQYVGYGGYGGLDRP